jgi:hypothetical protein
MEELLLPAPTTGSGAGSGRATFAWEIPNIPALQGLTVYLSALVLEPSVNTLGLTNSSGLRAVIQ